MRPGKPATHALCQRRTRRENQAYAPVRPPQGPDRPVHDRDVGAFFLFRDELAARPLSGAVPAAARAGSRPYRLRAVKGRAGNRVRHAHARSLCGANLRLFTGIAYSAPIVGGYVADRFLGQRITAVAGALLMAAGHFLMTFEVALFFALACLILGIGRLQAECLDPGRLALRRR